MHSADERETRWRSWNASALVLSAFVPFVLALFRASNDTSVIQDAMVIRTLDSASSHSVFGQGVESVLGDLWTVAPIGTLAFRLTLVSALGLGALGVAAYSLALSLLGKGRRLHAMAALVAAFGSTFNCAALQGSSIPLGDTIGAAASVATLSLFWARAEAGIVCLMAGLSISSSPLTAFICAGPLFHSLVSSKRRDFRMVLGLALGLVPVLWTVHRGTWSGSVLLAKWQSPMAFLRDDVGMFTCVGAMFGLVLLTRGDRVGSVGVWLAIVGGAVSSKFGARFGMQTYGSIAIVAWTLAVCLTLYAGALFVRWIRSTKVAYAHASSLLVASMFAVLPMRLLDDALIRMTRTRTTALVDEVLFEDLGLDAVVLLLDARTIERFDAARSLGVLRPDVRVLNLADLRRAPQDAKLLDLLRDVLLMGEPEERTLSKLAELHPVYLEYNPLWSASLSKHLLPSGALLRFESEPRGLAERKLSFERWIPSRDALKKDLSANRDFEANALVAKWMRRRALSIATTGERDSTSRAIDDLRTFESSDPLISELVRRIVVSGGNVAVRDLVHLL